MNKQILAIALVALGIPAWADAGGKRAKPAPARTPPWLRVDAHRAKDGEVGAIYQALYLSHCVVAPAAGGSPPPPPADFRFSQSCARVEAQDEARYGIWEFQAPPADSDRWPSIARHIVFATTGPSYKVTATVLCEHADDACRRFTSDTLHMPPPDPTTFVGQDSPQAKGWWVAVGNEPCEPGPSRSHPPEYPREALANGVTGTVMLLMLTNSCGDVRVVRVERSSHDRSLDRAAVNAASRWRTTPHVEKDPGQRYHWVRVPVDFNL